MNRTACCKLTQSELLLGEELVFTELLDLTGKHLLGGSSAVNAASFNGDEKTATLLQEQLRVDTDDSGLVGLGNIGENDIDHREKHAVGHRLASVLNDTVAC